MPHGPTYGITLSVPIFSGFATQSRVRQALFQRDAVADALEQEKRAIMRTTRGAFRNLISGAAEVEARRLAVVSAQAAYEAGEAGLEVGTRTIVDVLIAQQQLFLAKREYARSRHAYLVNLLRLRQAAGILARPTALVNRSCAPTRRRARPRVPSSQSRFPIHVSPIPRSAHALAPASPRHARFGARSQARPPSHESPSHAFHRSVASINR